MKKYSIIMTETETGINIKRENTGFNIFEMIGFVESIRSELITQLVSMDNKNKTVERIAYDDDGNRIDIDVNKNKVETHEVKE